MAGPEDSTTSTNHHGNPPDPADLCLQDNEDSSFMDEKPGLSPPAPHISLHPHTDSPTTEMAAESEPGPCLRIDLREGKEKKTLANTSQTPPPKTSQTVSQRDETSDDIDVSNHHPHLFFIEDDDDGDADNDDNDIEEETLGNDVDDDDDAFEGNDGKQNECGCFPSDANQQFQCSAESREAGKSEHGFEEQDHFGDLPRSIPMSIPGPSSSLTTVCRRGSHSQVVVRCQIQSTCSSMKHAASSCPNAFSPVWTQVSPPNTQPGDNLHSSPGRKRLNTLAGSRPNWPSTPRQGEGGHDPESPQDDPTQATFKGRSRSYSDSDVQRLLIKEVSKELRRIGDEFSRIRRRRPTPVINEPIMEEGHGSEI